MEFGACGDLFYGLIIGGFAVNNVFQYLELLFFSILGALIMLSTFIIIRTLAIWIGNVEEIDHIYKEFNPNLLSFCIGQLNRPLNFIFNIQKILILNRLTLIFYIFLIYSILF